MDSINFAPFILSFKLALTTTLILLMVSIPIAWYLAFSKSRIKPIVEAVVALPIVLPPSVLGFYILILFSKNSPIGEFLVKNFNIELIFSFTGLVIASVIYSFPFMVQPLQSGFESLNRNMIEASFVSGKSLLTTIFKVAIPNIKPALLTAIVITFAHTVGEFGVVLMVGGSIDGETKVASIAIYEMVESLEYKTAHIYSAILLIFSFITLFIVYSLNRKFKVK